MLGRIKKASKLRGSIDRLNADEIVGWAFDSDSATAAVPVRLELNGTVIAEGKTDQSRADVSQSLKAKGNFGFRFDTKQLVGISAKDLSKIVVMALHERSGAWVSLPRMAGATPRPRSQYQSFEDVAGGSKSSDKLTALRLQRLRNKHSAEKPLRGLKVLDIGCNEGFFCREAIRQGATRVLGIDKNAPTIEAARTRVPEAEFRVGTWWDIPDEKFDVIFFLSAIHYEPEQKKLLRKLRDHLTPNGTLILECGISPSNNIGLRTWQAVRRGDGVKRYPNLELLRQDLMEDFAVRWIGHSVLQAGDPVQRHVFHCTPLQNTVLLVAAEGYAGKSVLAELFSGFGIPVFKVDAFFGRIILQEEYQWAPIAKKLAQFRDRSQGLRLDDAGRFIVANNLADEFVELLLWELPLEPRMLCVEGEILRHTPVLERLEAELRKRQVVPWVVGTPASFMGAVAQAAPARGAAAKPVVEKPSKPELPPITDVEGIPLPTADVVFMGQSPEAGIRTGRRQVELLGGAGLNVKDGLLLDIGCGYGRLAYGLAASKFAGRYVGVDITKDRIEWLQQNFTPANNRYTFHFSDVKNDLYNKEGAQARTSYSSILNGEKATAITLLSVFTHMYPEDIEAHLREIMEVMSADTKLLFSCFLLDGPSAEAMKEGKARRSFQFEHSPGVRYDRKNNPLGAIGFDEPYLRNIVERVGLGVDSVLRGSWTRMKKGGFAQDVFVCRLRNHGSM